MAHDVFISYSSFDKDVADAVYSILEKKGIKCWMAPRNITPGMPFAEAIIHGIESSKVFILIYSLNSNNSTQVLREVDRAVHNGLSIINFRLEDVPLSKQLEYYISSVHWLDATSPSLEKHIHQLSNVVQMFLKPGEVKNVEITEAIKKGIIKHEEQTVPSKRSRLAKRRRLLASGILLAVVIAIVSLNLFKIGSKANNSVIYKNIFSSIFGKTKNTIAVLPLKVIGIDSDAGYFANGLVESLVHMLTKIGINQQTFSVIPTSEIININSASDARKCLGATIVISGSIQLDSEDYRLILNLTDAKKQRLLGSEKIDYHRDNSLILQDKVISVIIKMLEIQITTVTQKIVQDEIPASVEVNEAYLKGKGLLLDYKSLDELDPAIDLFNKVIVEDSLFAPAYSELARAYWNKYNYTKNPDWANLAIINGQKAISLNNSDASIHINLGIIYRDKGEFETALGSFQKAIILEPRNEDAYNQIGILYRKQGDHEKAETFLKKAISLNSNYWRSYNNLAVLFYVEGEYEKAINQLEKGLQRAPTNQLLLNNLAGFYYALQKFPEAIKIFESILETNPDDYAAISNLGTICYYNGNYDKAIFYYKQFITINPDDYRAYAWLGSAYYHSKNEMLGKSMYNSAIKAAKQNMEFEPDVTLLIVQLYGRLGMLDSANFFLNKIIIPANPEKTNARKAFHIGEMYFAIGKINLSIVWFESALKRNYGWRALKYDSEFNDANKYPSIQKLIEKYKPSYN